ncbi:MAG: hypothetical protein CVU90_10965 [Firmicutes bacterium HGW-Firmicutes-15]|nr:MAG: hypothetical protein CVU90_10965 [Firmicutes bacterium HGW-Firmicutes-15]
MTLNKTDKVSKGDESVSIWEELGKKYDVRNATFDEICDISTKLYSAGQISLGDHLMLTFDWKRAADELRKTYPETVADLNLTPADGNGRRDWIAEFEARTVRDFHADNTKGYIQNQKLTQILGRIENSK